MSAIDNEIRFFAAIFWVIIAVVILGVFLVVTSDNSETDCNCKKVTEIKVIDPNRTVMH